MPIPASMKIEGIEGGSTISGREGHIEVLEFNHEVRIPTDSDTGGLTSTRKHEPFTFVKAYDKATPLLYKAVSEGKTIEKVELTWYMIDDSGSEVPYFKHTLTNVKVCSVNSFMNNVKHRDFERFVHMDRVSFRYAKIEWEYLDGNIKHTDSWIEGR